ncbi:two-component regulator propeller domain-containing protein [Luteolibacter sp. LG18]|uniref:sensor histidine kinase n=1 Tax=Luteolibacter sp. LG18 TaxID=2819286 RepID=UPI002B2D61B3|nr:GGDEF domain-containing protein [Luteolibacter sp. LG18]
MLRLLVLLLALVSPAVADETVGRPGFLIRAWQSDEGLPGNVVRSVGQTPDGFLWIATAEGLSRFDGNEFESIAATGVWFGRPLDFSRVFTPADGSVWAATSRCGLFRVGSAGLDGVIGDYEGPNPGVVARLFTCDGSTYFVRNDRLWRVGASTAEAVDAPSPAVIQAMAADQASQRQRGRQDKAGPPDRLLDHNGGTWRIDDRGLSYIAPDESADPELAIAFSGSMESLDMLEDREGNLWVASPIRGLVRIRHSRAVRLPYRDGFYTSPTRTSIQSRDGTWWIARRNGGVDRIENGILLHIPIVTSNTARVVSSIVEDHTGRIWISSRDASVFAYNPETQHVDAQFLDTPALSKINVMVEDHEGRMWFGGRAKLFCWDGTSLRRVNEVTTLENVEISTLAPGDNGTLYIGTGNGRIFTLKGTELSLVGNVESFPRSSVSKILPIAPDEIWAATLGAGLLLWKDGGWHRFSTREGIPDERLTALTLVGDDLWMGSLGGILRVSRKDLLQSLKDKTPVPKWLRLDRSDGLATRECIGWTQPGVFRDSTGCLWFPTSAGLTGVKPDDIETTAVAPSIHFQPVEINGVPHAVDGGRIVTGPGRVRLGFRFTGLSLSAPEKVTYRVKLNGLDENSRGIGGIREAEYQLVPPGRYTFEVSATNGDGITTPRPAIIQIEVLPHFWQRTWFIVIALIAAILLPLFLGWLVARHRMKVKIRELRLQGALEAERTRISRDLHDDLGASLTEVSILSELAAEDNHDESLRPALDQLSLKAKHVVGALDEIVWATTPSQDKLASVVEYLSFFARDFLKAVHIPLHTDITRDIPDVTIGPRRRHNIVLASREALNNAVKHAKPTAISLRITIEDGMLVVCIQDDGKGFAVEYEESGNGLTNMGKRMTDCGGDCRIESVRGKGTSITLTIPLIRRTPR